LSPDFAKPDRWNPTINSSNFSGVFGGSKGEAKSLQLVVFRGPLPGAYSFWMRRGGFPDSDFTIRSDVWKKMGRKKEGEEPLKESDF